ncbi:MULTISPECIES: hypothetical protein [Mycetohabitans]|uniref:hypothetical protein n=1 Tax=Mycetohabitans TaxID=2571159 RepID=UPI001F354013|nr:hypothetical protein [Mycetohabitans sp. B3]MCF2134482.1 hypothetical protein [Mycetohabitans sp. B3]
MDFNTTPPPNAHNAAIYASIDSHKSGSGNSPSSGFFSGEDPNTAQRQAPASYAGMAPMDRVYAFLKKTLREEDGAREVRLEPLRELLDGLHRDVADPYALLQALDKLAMSGINKFPRTEQTEAFTHIFAASLKIPNSEAFRDKMIHHFEEDYRLLITWGFDADQNFTTESMIAVFDDILCRTINSPLEKRREILPDLARLLGTYPWNRAEEWATIEGRPYKPLPELGPRFDRLLDEMTRLDDIGRARLSTELARRLFLLHCLDRTHVLKRYQRLLNYVEALPKDLQSSSRYELGRAIRWLPERIRLAAYESMLEAANRLTTYKGEALAGLPEAMIGLSAAEQSRRLQQWKYEILPMLDPQDQKPIVAAFLETFSKLTEGNNSEFALTLALDGFDRISSGQGMNKDMFNDIIRGITNNDDLTHYYSPETLERVLDLNSQLPPPIREMHLLDLEDWFDLKLAGKALNKQEQLLLPIQARIRDERAKLTPEPLFNFDPDPPPLTWWEDSNQPKAVDRAGSNRRHRSFVDWIKARMGRQ